MTSDAAHQAPAAVYVGEFAGTPIFAPPGTPLMSNAGAMDGGRAGSAHYSGSAGRSAAGRIKSADVDGTPTRAAA